MTDPSTRSRLPRLAISCSPALAPTYRSPTMWSTQAKLAPAPVSITMPSCDEKLSHGGPQAAGGSKVLETSPPPEPEVDPSSVSLVVGVGTGSVGPIVVPEEPSVSAVVAPTVSPGSLAVSVSSGPGTVPSSGHAHMTKRTGKRR
ncbi:hypothetical protein OV079_20710 [Nannocystis pusilla]|uniref:Uncharacterized protein n=1 Tax=Nannocystis pusilla TaxID=889268 RepID=A0A9X3IX00_9BACT|nr:hypothetical protein [Nannocystis pusilla]MCY1007932.1 hypothetical protein [Nannocystis pusilla]